MPIYRESHIGTYQQGKLRKRHCLPSCSMKLLKLNYILSLFKWLHEEMS